LSWHIYKSQTNKERIMGKEMYGQSCFDSREENVSKKIDLEKNPNGTEIKVYQQREREKHGRYVSVPGDKTHTRIFVRDGEDAEKKIATYLERINNRPQKWN
jgi:hypothetical protein